MGQKKQRQKGHQQGYGTVPVRPGRIPPPESELWPPWCRGELWNWEAARFYVGRCQLCAYSCPASEGRRRLDKLTGLPTLLVCTNHPDSPGKMRDVIATDTCRNFKQKRWLRGRLKPTEKVADAAVFESDKRIRRIPLGHDLFAIVDARDYKWLSKYKWCALNRNGQVYAVRRNRQGQTVYMHRAIMKAPPGMVVDHIDHNTLNNRRCNLRICTREQNYANAGPRGASSGFVGVHRCGHKWRSGITCRGVYHLCGRFDDPVEAAKARDRKAYQLHGPLAFINLPEELQRWLRQQARKKAGVRQRKRRLRRQE